MTEVSKRATLLGSKVLVLVTANPKKKPSMSYDRFANYFKCAKKFPDGFTVEQALKEGVRMDDIRHDSAHGYIVVGEADIKAAEARLKKDREAAIEAARKLLAEVEAAAKVEVKAE